MQYEQEKFKREQSKVDREVHELLALIRLVCIASCLWNSTSCVVKLFQCNGGIDELHLTRGVTCTKSLDHARDAQMYHQIRVIEAFLFLIRPSLSFAV
jgi:hypothetical protein